MEQIAKDQLRNNAQTHVRTVQKHISEDKNALSEQVAHLEQIIVGAEKGSHDEESTDIEKILVSEKKERLEQLNKLTESPYFTKCLVKFDREKSEKTVYFGKFAFFPDAIYSWTTPIAKLRYETPGEFNYVSPDDDFPITGKLLYKEQYMIVDGSIVFMAAEGVDLPRELVYQERLVRRKSDFSLPEIVEQMEKAQDEVIRAHWKGSFLISGPAGSGKTTLALHRVAYLTQAPETEQVFPSHSIIVFVQDASTKAYFSKLLPELGIKRVVITTFDEWIISKLQLTNVTFEHRFGTNEDERDLFEFAKNSALKNFDEGMHEIDADTINHKDPFVFLNTFYSAYFTSTQNALFLKQTQARILDRFDLSVLGKRTLFKDGAITEDRAEYELLKRMKSKKTIKKTPLSYSLIVVDEAENFLKEQIEILLSCTSKKTKAVLYVGDLAQQTRAYTVRDWSSVGESFESGRKVVLYKVYRNTRQILEYINSIGFSAAIPEGLKDGKEVKEFAMASKSQEMEQVEELIEKNNHQGIVGILGKTDIYLESYRKLFENNKNVHILTINEAQGVEFDAVYLVGINSEYFGAAHFSKELGDERRHVDHDLLYVALTRAMNELYVFGKNSLKEIVNALSD